MSSRAIRRAQQQQEEEERAALASAQQNQNPNGTDEQDESESEEEEPPRQAFSKLNPFDMLNEADTNEEDDTAPDEVEEEEHDSDDKKDENTTTALGENPQPTTQKNSIASPPNTPLNSVLAIETQHLQITNELRRLFGRVVDQPPTPTNDDPNPDAQRRRRQQRGRGQEPPHGPQQQRGSGGLATLGWRRNIFIKASEEWPKASSGGLSMEKVGPWTSSPTSSTSSKESEDKNNKPTEYRFIHSKTYQSQQQAFVLCVQHNNVQGLNPILNQNPYHIASLTQLSQIILSQQSDPARANDIISRVLFSFGRALHSTFASALSNGTARLDFARPENREFWLAGWNYIQNLGMRGTWRTAFEWAKLLFALDPERDPYRMSLVIDQIAIRARQFESYVKIIEAVGYLNKPVELLAHHYPNIMPSAALAKFHIGGADNLSSARALLEWAVTNTPWLFERLYKTMNIDPIPACIWGTIAPSSPANLLTEIYVTGSKDIWNTPENRTFLTSVVSSVNRSEVNLGIMDDQEQIHISEARHTALLRNTNLTLLVPATILFRESAVDYDPVPPVENKPSYALPVAIDPHGQATAHRDGEEETLELVAFDEETELMADP